MRILLFGANGQVGHELRRALTPLGNLVCATRSGLLGDGAPCEVADFDHPATLPALVDRIAPDVVVNAAAYTAVDKAEAERDAAFRANAEAPHALARACAERDALLVHYSTDYVFDGSGTRPYREDDPTSPLGIYGASKLAGEQAVQGSGARHLIFRTAWVYATHGRNFMLTMLRLAKERDQLKVIADQIGAPTGAELLADVTAQAIRTTQDKPELAGLYHLVAGGETSWYDYAQFVIAFAKQSGETIRVTPDAIKPIPTTDYPTPAKRPLNSRLDTTKLKTTFDLQLPDWRDGVRRVLTEILGK